MESFEVVITLISIADFMEIQSQSDLSTSDDDTAKSRILCWNFKAIKSPYRTRYRIDLKQDILVFIIVSCRSFKLSSIHEDFQIDP